VFFPEASPSLAAAPDKRANTDANMQLDVIWTVGGVSSSEGSPVMHDICSLQHLQHAQPRILVRQKS
jgi:hypothetical protein